MDDLIFGRYTMDGGTCRACEQAGRTTTIRAGRDAERWYPIIKRTLRTDDGEAVLAEVCPVCDLHPPAPHRTGGQP